MKVLIINQYAGNKGDRAVAYFELRELLKKKHIERIYLSTNAPSWWKNDLMIEGNKRITLVPWGWNVEGFDAHNRIHWERRRLMRNVVLPLVAFCYLHSLRIPLFLARLFTNNEFINAIQDVDIVLSTGGHHLTTRFTPDLRNELFFDMATAAMYHPLILWSQTYGPFHFQSRLLKKACCKLLSTSKVFIRDIESEQAIRTLGICPPIIKTYESVIGLENEIKEYVLPSQRDKVVGITIYNAEQRSQVQYDDYIRLMSQVVDYLCGIGYKVQFFPHEIKGAIVDDRNCIRDIISLCNNKESVSYHDIDEPISQHLLAISQCCMFIGHKTHSVIFALTVGTPLLAIAYHSKTRDFLSQYGLGSNCIEEPQMTFEDLTVKLNKILSNLDTIGKKQHDQSKMFGEIVRKHFSELTNI